MTMISCWKANRLESRPLHVPAGKHLRNKQAFRFSFSCAYYQLMLVLTNRAAVRLAFHSSWWHSYCYTTWARIGHLWRFRAAVVFPNHTLEDCCGGLSKYLVYYVMKGGELMQTSAGGTSYLAILVSCSDAYFGLFVSIWTIPRPFWSISLSIWKYFIVNYGICYWKQNKRGNFYFIPGMLRFVSTRDGRGHFQFFLIH